VAPVSRSTAVAGTLKSAKEQLFSALDDLHERGDERIHSGDPRHRNAAALEIADRLGHPATQGTIRKHAAEWAKLKNPDEAD
jgi:hypothetical protein